MAKDYARWFYDSDAWKKTRASYMSSKHYICEVCGGVACIVHHIRHITPDNINNPDITLNFTNLKAVCYSCHESIHARSGNGARCNGIAFDEAGNVIKEADVFLVCGSPASGKSAYVASRKNNNDLVVDLDYICAALMGELNNIYLNHEPILSAGIEIRTLLYTIIKARRGKWAKAYVITTIASVAEQRAVANELNAELVLINTPLDECIKRLHNDERRADKAKIFEDLIIKWHEDYNKSMQFASIPPTFDKIEQKFSPTSEPFRTPLRNRA